MSPTSRARWLRPIRRGRANSVIEASCAIWIKWVVPGENVWQTGDVPEPASGRRFPCNAPPSGARLRREVARMQTGPAWKKLHGLWRVYRVPLGFGIRVTAAAILAFLVAQLFALPLHGLWVVLTATVVT